jgi:hypothetical protein
MQCDLFETYPGNPDKPECVLYFQATMGFNDTLKFLKRWVNEKPAGVRHVDVYDGTLKIQIDRTRE